MTQKRNLGSITPVFCLCFASLSLCTQKVMLSPITSQRTFTLVTNPPRGITRLSSPWFEKSKTLCAVACTMAYANCLSFIFNSKTGLCTPGFSFNYNEHLPSPEEGDLYYSFACNEAEGFSIQSYNDTRACIGIFGPHLSYQDADASCQSKGGFLMSVKTWNKLQILVNLWGYAESDLWVGCDDLATEGIYVWKEDGSTFTNVTKPITLGASEPNDYKGREDCLSISSLYDQKLIDRECSLVYPHVCEMPLP